MQQTALRAAADARLGRLMDELGHPVDLVDLDLESGVAEFLEQEGQLTHVG